jgi:hypothetical protein
VIDDVGTIEVGVSVEVAIEVHAQGLDQIPIHDRALFFVENVGEAQA